MKKEYKSLSKYYDLIHKEKNYSKESIDFTKIINKYKKSRGKNLLDLACGTGSHIYFLRKKFNATGIDLSKYLIKIAKKKNPGIKFIVGDIIKFKLSKKFDIITFLFNSIAYLKNKKEIANTINNSYRMLNSGGILFIETIFLKDSLKEIKDHIRKYSDKNLNIKRTLKIKIRDGFALLGAKYKIKERNNPQKTIYDTQRVKLFSTLELKRIIESVGFKVKIYDYERNRTKLFICLKE